MKDVFLLVLVPQEDRSLLNGIQANLLKQFLKDCIIHVHLLGSLHLKCSVAKLHDEINSKLACSLYALANVLSIKLSVFVDPYCHIDSVLGIHIIFC